MMYFILLAIVIYVALVGASLTIMAVALSDWYMKKCTKTTKKVMDNYLDE